MTDLLVHSLCRQSFGDVETFNDHVGVGPSPGFADRAVKCPVLLRRAEQESGRAKKHESNAARQRAYRERKRNAGA